MNVLTDGKVGCSRDVNLIAVTLTGLQVTQKITGILRLFTALYRLYRSSQNRRVFQHLSSQRLPCKEDYNNPMRLQSFQMIMNRIINRTTTLSLKKNSERIPVPDKNTGLYFFNMSTHTHTYVHTSLAHYIILDNVKT